MNSRHILAFTIISIAALARGPFVERCTGACPDKAPSTRSCLLTFPVCGGWGPPGAQSNCTNRTEQVPYNGLFWL